MSPTADQVGWAIVAAARETNEDPEACAMRAIGLNCRHYALHSLARVFPEANKAKLAWLVGAPGESLGFYRNSVSQKFHQFVAGPRAGKRMAKWWDEEAFERVVAAVRSAATAEDGEDTARVATPRAPVKLSAKVESIVEPTRPAAAPGKRKLEDMLRAAVQNTQRMTPPPE